MDSDLKITQAADPEAAARAGYLCCPECAELCNLHVDRPRFVHIGKPVVLLVRCEECGHGWASDGWILSAGKDAS